MIILGCENISFSYGVDNIIENITFSLNEKERLGIVGVNGAGKSTLIKIISGEITDFSGSFYIAKGKSLATLKQDAAFESDGTLLGEILLAFESLAEKEKELEELRQRLDSGDISVLERFTSLNDSFISEGGLEYKSRCRAILLNLGFSEREFDMPISAFSGGQKTRIALAKVLISSPDLLILDEPTNHLDTKTLEWLEEYLRSYKNTLIVISHDRYFLDRVTSKTLEIENTHGRMYNGNYSFYVEAKRKDREIQRRHYINQQREIKRIEDFIENQKRWNRERNIIAAESRQKMLDKMERVDAPEKTPDEIQLSFDYAGNSGTEVLSTYYLSKSFENKLLFDKLNLLVKRKDRLFIVGDNGTGKSTLVKVLNHKIRATEGRFEYGNNVYIGYYDQENQQLTQTNSVVDELWSAAPTATVTKIRNTLALFLFKGDDIFKRVQDLSGGERARLTLAKLSMKKTNLLILDEPTNHLDIDTREVLEGALSRYEGTIIAVSHDRYFTRKLANRILEIRRDGEHFDFFGNYDYYLSKRKEPNVNLPPQIKEETDAKTDYLNQKKTAAEERKKQNAYKKSKAEAEKIEKRLDDIEKECEAVPDGDYITLQKLYEEKKELEDSLLHHYEIIEEYNSSI